MVQAERAGVHWIPALSFAGLVTPEALEENSEELPASDPGSFQDGIGPDYAARVNTWDADLAKAGGWLRSQ